jgi:glycosyltransferase involved in cell wall biosynthesis
LLLDSDRVILTHNSEFGSLEYLDWLGPPESKHVTIHNGLDLAFQKAGGKKKFDLRSNLGIENDSIIVGYVGRFTTDKRPWLFLKVAEMILLNGHHNDSTPSRELEEWFIHNEGQADNSDKRDHSRLGKRGPIHFVMVGDGPQFEKAKKIVVESEIMNGSVHLVGFSSEVESYLRNFDCFLLTSKVEGLPNVIIEAQSCGVPVVATNVGGSRECFVEGETGLLALNGTPEEIGNLLTQVLTDKKFRKNASAMAPKFADAKFGQKAYANSINNLYSGKVT